MSSEAVQYPMAATTFTFFFFSFTVFFSFFSFLVFLFRMKPWCNCDTCRAYLTMSWTKQFNNLADWYTHLLRKSPTATIHMHVLGNIITADPENVEYILKTRFDNYPKGKPFSTLLGDLLGRGIFNVDGEEWRFQRKMASLELGSVAIRSYALEVVTDEIRSRLIPVLNQIDGVIDLQDIFRRFSFDNICVFSFGLDPGCLIPSLSFFPCHFLHSSSHSHSVTQLHLLLPREFHFLYPVVLFIPFLSTLLHSASSKERESCEG